MDVTPQDLPIRHRATVRVLLLDDLDRVLLLHDSDLGLPPEQRGQRWWMTPGGGIDPGEDVVRAGVRELAEETGLTIMPTDVLGPMATVHVHHGYSDKVIESDDTYVVVRVPAFEIDTAGFTADEQATVLGHHWWTRAELTATDEIVWPANLAELWTLADDPARWPVQLPDADESSC